MSTETKRLDLILGALRVLSCVLQRGRARHHRGERLRSCESRRVRVVARRVREVGLIVGRRAGLALRRVGFEQHIVNKFLEFLLSSATRVVILLEHLLGHLFHELTISLEILAGIALPSSLENVATVAKRGAEQCRRCCIAIALGGRQAVVVELWVAQR